MEAKNSIYFTHNHLPNFHIEVNSNGVRVWVSLNIESSMKKYLEKNNIFKAEKMWTYCLRKQLDSINFKTLEEVYKQLMNRAMINCREAKRKVLEQEIKQLQSQN